MIIQIITFKINANDHFYGLLSDIYLSSRNYKTDKKIVFTGKFLPPAIRDGETQQVRSVMIEEIHYSKGPNVVVPRKANVFRPQTAWMDDYESEYLFIANEAYFIDSLLLIKMDPNPFNLIKIDKGTFGYLTSGLNIDEFKFLLRTFKMCEMVAYKSDCCIYAANLIEVLFNRLNLCRNFKFYYPLIERSFNHRFCPNRHMFTGVIDVNACKTSACENNGLTPFRISCSNDNLNDLICVYIPEIGVDYNFTEMLLFAKKDTLNDLIYYRVQEMTNVFYIDSDGVVTNVSSKRLCDLNELKTIIDKFNVE
ncbi:hypothetical protein CHISP_3757 [Chitinispirillum alkaliphilum]|nr:hypothetical protein CHISP_3757 [Chitinispirillum alkaliphilum]